MTDQSLLSDRGISWERHGDLMRTQIQETGRIRLAFLSLADLAAAINDLGIDPRSVRFYHGYAIVNESAAAEIAAALEAQND